MQLCKGSFADSVCVGEVCPSNLKSVLFFHLNNKEGNIIIHEAGGGWKENLSVTVQLQEANSFNT